MNGVNESVNMVFADSCAAAFEQAVQGVLRRLTRNAEQKRTALLLVSGGESLAVSVQALSQLTADQLSYVTIAQLDEIYGPVDHERSHWLQLKQTFGGLDACRRTLCALHEGESFSETVNNYDYEITNAIKETDYTLAVLGIASHGGLAGISPKKAEDFQIFFNDDFIAGYDDDGEERVTITDYGMRVLSDIVVFACDPSAKEVLRNLEQHIPVHQQPAQLLKIYDRVTVYTEHL